MWRDAVRSYLRGMTALNVRHLHKRYGQHVAVDDVSFTVDEGEIFGIIGPNGAGKTTTVESIAGLRTPDSGSISVLGLDPIKDRAEVREQLGVQLQESSFPDAIKVVEALKLYSSFYRDPVDWRELLELLGLTEKRNTQYKALSGGQKQRLSIALALVGNPRSRFSTSSRRDWTRRPGARPGASSSGCGRQA